TVLFYSCKDKTEKKVAKYYSTEIELKVDSITIYGTLQMPDSVGEYPVVLIIAGSGPTDRDGNNKLGVSAAPYRMLADSLAAHNIATLRYDKRLIAKSVVKNAKESELRFDDYISDAQNWIKLLKADGRFSKIIVLGHSEGSLIGAIAANRENPDAFISLAGAGRPIDVILIEQLSKGDYDLDEVRGILDDIKAGKIVIPPDNLKTIFRVTVQPYMTSWLKYIPAEVFSKLTMPVLILQGTTDIQILPEDAENLHKACKHSELAIIKEMNHVLKTAPADRDKNIATYNNKNLPLHSELTPIIVNFINN
ncbi:MAG: alpha/beta hydrolase, partial [Bacteroidota bacterium]|nr:alpha/beta hydrolase [Bacteroidota bacterium]